MTQPAILNAREACGAWADATDHELARLEKAVMLATDLKTLRALLEHKQVPDENLDPRWLAAYGLKRHAA